MESRRKIVGTNAISLFISQAIARIATFIASIYLIRYLGINGYGQYSTIIAYTGLFSVVFDLGLGQLITREIAKDKSKSSVYLGNFLILQLFVGLFVFFLLVTVFKLLNFSPELTLATTIYGLSLLINSLSIPFQSLISAYEKMSLNSLGNILSSFLTAILLILAINSKLNLLGIMAVYSIGSVILLIFLSFVCLKFVAKPVFNLKPILWKKLIITALPFALVSILSVVYNKIDILMLSKMKNDAVVGIYNAAYRFVDIWWIIPIAINNAFFPHMAKQFNKDKEMLKKNIKRVFLFQGSLGLLIAFSLTIFADFIIHFLFGNKFTPSVGLLQILIWYVPLNFAAGSLANVLMAIGKTEKFAIAAFINVILVILLNFLLIPQYSFWGTSFTTLLSGLVLLFLCGFFVWKEKLI